jgi:hypothetical protein
MKPWIETENGEWVNTRNIIYITHNERGTALHLNDGDVLPLCKEKIDLVDLITAIRGEPLQFDKKQEK